MADRVSFSKVKLASGIVVQRFKMFLQIISIPITDYAVQTIIKYQDAAYSG